MKIKFYSNFIIFPTILVLGGCSGLFSKEKTNQSEVQFSTPTVDYVESLDLSSAGHNDSFLNQLAMNYRSYAIYNARTSGYYEMGEMFAQKSVVAFSGETPFPESLENWPIEDENLRFELHTACNQLLEKLRNDAADDYPELAAEAQAKYDCWLSATASAQMDTANECKVRFEKAMNALDGSGFIVKEKTSAETFVKKSTEEKVYYPETRSMTAVGTSGRAREGIVIVNNVNIPENLIVPVPVTQQQGQPIVFNQNIYGGDKTITKTTGIASDNKSDIPMIGDQLVTRDEFINMMIAMRSELQAINARLDSIEAKSGEKTVLKVQQIPLEPKQHVMEEIFEIRFDFNKATIKPEYEDLVRRLATVTQENKNVKVTIVGHTDTVGDTGYNFALGGKRAESVQKMLVKYGIPSNQIVSVSAGEKDNKVQTGDNVPNPDNRRVRVVKEVHFTEPGKVVTPKVEIEEIK